MYQKSSILDLSKGSSLFRTGDKVEGIYLVINGEIKAMRTMINGHETVMMRSASGEYFGESALAISNYICDAISTKQSTIGFIPKPVFLDAMNDDVFATQFSLTLAKNMRRQCSRIERLRLHKAKDRVLHLLTCESNQQGSFIWGSSYIELASELAIEPETLYRVLAELEKDDVISRDKKHIQLINII